ncbi:MAG: sulfatase-like hydrolase/transferase [Anaerolineales bacterium]|nr:sulfatase-like hydrolase/transferase [Anaerolineales bacterium]
MSQITRRDFLKLTAATTPAVLLPRVASWLDVSQKQNDELPNIVILLFDAMTAKNLALYGYPRPTSSNFERFANRATVYHSHYASGNYTIPGTASLLTGAYPWTHRALNYGGQARREMANKSIFTALGKDYYRIGFAQNIWAQMILTQFKSDLDVILPPGTFGELDYLWSRYFPNDENMAVRALDDFVFKMTDRPTSMVFGPIQQALFFRDSARLDQKGYPEGLPHSVDYPLYFRLESVFKGLASLLQDLPSPFFTYFHLFPPHTPYHASDRFDSQFIDGWFPNKKPVHRFSKKDSSSKINSARRKYDEYVATVDWEFGKLMDALEEAGIFESSYVVITSDHGEMFERGEKAHSTVLLYDPVIQVPLLISAPGQRVRKDVYTPTNAVDVLPTLAQLGGKPIPSWCEGKLLPGLGGVDDPTRSTYVIEAKNNPAFVPLHRATVVLRKGNYKLIYYTGYEPEDTFEFYDLSEDIEEIKDLYPEQLAVTRQMKEELLETLFEVNKPYTG